METKQIIKQLKAYQSICNEAIEKAREAKIKDAVNWDDLKCNEVIFVINDKGDNFYQFIISEASPDCEDFKGFIQQYLIDKVDLYPEIVTEW